MQGRRGGFTLVELLIVAVLGGLVLASAYQTLTVQERSIRHSYAIISVQRNTQTAIEVMTSDLRELSATDGDVLAADSTFISIRALRKAGVVCAVDPLGVFIDVAEIGAPFASGDSLLVFSDGANPSSAIDDAWIALAASDTAVAPSGTCAGNPLSSTIRRIDVSAAPSGVIAGGLVRSWLPVRYRLINQGSGGVLSRVEGPDSVALIDDLSTIADQGLRFRYWDTVSVAMQYNTLNSNLTSIGRIQMKVRGAAIGANAGRLLTDSLVSTIQLRGNRKLR